LNTLGLFKDALSAIFFLAIMLFSRLIGKEELLDSENVHWLFKILAGYLFVSPLIRIYFERQSLILALSDLSHWKDTTRNHISHKDVNDLIGSRTKPYKCLYRKAMLLVVLSSIALSIFAWNIPSILKQNTVLVVQSSSEVNSKPKPTTTNQRLLEEPSNEKKLELDIAHMPASSKSTEQELKKAPITK
jgi:hypothetical protein